MLDIIMVRMEVLFVVVGKSMGEWQQRKVATEIDITLSGFVMKMLIEGCMNAKEICWPLR